MLPFSSAQPLTGPLPTTNRAQPPIAALGLQQVGPDTFFLPTTQAPPPLHQQQQQQMQPYFPSDTPSTPQYYLYAMPPPLAAHAIFPSPIPYGQPAPVGFNAPVGAPASLMSVEALSQPAQRSHIVAPGIDNRTPTAGAAAAAAVPPNASNVNVRIGSAAAPMARAHPRNTASRGRPGESLRQPRQHAGSATRHVNATAETSSYEVGSRYRGRVTSIRFESGGYGFIKVTDELVPVELDWAEARRIFWEQKANTIPPGEDVPRRREFHYIKGQTYEWKPLEDAPDMFVHTKNFRVPNNYNFLDADCVAACMRNSSEGAEPIEDEASLPPLPAYATRLYKQCDVADQQALSARVYPGSRVRFTCSLYAEKNDDGTPSTSRKYEAADVFLLPPVGHLVITDEERQRQAVAAARAAESLREERVKRELLAHPMVNVAAANVTQQPQPQSQPQPQPQPQHQQSRFSDAAVAFYRNYVDVGYRHGTPSSTPTPLPPAPREGATLASVGLPAMPAYGQLDLVLTPHRSPRFSADAVPSLGFAPVLLPVLDSPHAAVKCTRVDSNEFSFLSERCGLAPNPHYPHHEAISYNTATTMPFHNFVDDASAHVHDLTASLESAALRRYDTKSGDSDDSVASEASVSAAVVNVVDPASARVSTAEPLLDSADDNASTISAELLRFLEGKTSSYAASILGAFDDPE